MELCSLSLAALIRFLESGGGAGGWGQEEAPLFVAGPIAIIRAAFLPITLVPEVQAGTDHSQI